MKNFFRTSTAIVVGMALVMGFQYIPLQEILPAKAQTVRMVAGPHDYIFSTTYLTPTSNTLNSNLPTYALPTINMVSYTANLMGPVTLDLNADGLLDFAYTYWTDYGTSKSTDQYVLLNTGSGFNLAYICRYTYASSVHTYKGDCAQ